MKSLILSHADLDGIASVINIWNIDKSFDNFQYFLTGYTSLSRRLELMKKEQCEVLWITDMNLTAEQVGLLYEVYEATGAKKVIWIDHHFYKYDVQAQLDQYGSNWCMFIYDKEVCAAKSVNSFLNERFVTGLIPEAVNELSDITNVYDLWKRNDSSWKDAYALNDLFWEYGFEKFFKKFKNGYLPDIEDEITIENINSERDQYVQDTIKNYLIHNEEAKAAFIYNPACKHTNHFALVMYDVYWYVILKEVTEDTLSYSLRLYNPDLRLTIHEIFDKIKEDGVEIVMCGGHDRVGSVTVKKEHSNDLLEALNSFFEGKI